MTPPSRILRLDQRRREFVWRVVRGENAENVVMDLFPKCKNPIDKAMMLLSNKRVHTRIEQLSTYFSSKAAMKIRLYAVLENPKTRISEVNAALRLLARLDDIVAAPRIDRLQHQSRNAPTNPTPNKAKIGAVEDEDLVARIHEIEQKMRKESTNGHQERTA